MPRTLDTFTLRAQMAELIEAFDHVAHCRTCGYEAVSNCHEGTQYEERVREIERNTVCDNVLHPGDPSTCQHDPCACLGEKGRTDASR